MANLIELGANNTRVSKRIYDNNSLDRLKFLGFALSEKLIVLPEYSTAYFAITNEELVRYNSKTGDTEGLVKLCAVIARDCVSQHCLLIGRKP